MKTCDGCGQPMHWVQDDGRWMPMLLGENVVHRCKAYQREQRKGYLDPDKVRRHLAGLDALYRTGDK